MKTLPEDKSETIRQVLLMVYGMREKDPALLARYDDGELTPAEFAKEWKRRYPEDFKSGRH